MTFWRSKIAICYYRAKCHRIWNYIDRDFFARPKISYEKRENLQPHHLLPERVALLSGALDLPPQLDFFFDGGFLLALDFGAHVGNT